MAATWQLDKPVSRPDITAGAGQFLSYFGDGLALSCSMAVEFLEERERDIPDPACVAFVKETLKKI
jgi:hypothetical protein